MTDSLNLYTLGEALAVFIATDGLPLDAARSFRRTAAGSELNVAAGVRRLGLSSRFVTRVGDDALGAAVTAQVRGWDVDPRIEIVAGSSTGMLVRDTSSTSRPIEVVHARRGSAATFLSVKDVEASWPDEVDAVFLTGITGVLSESALEAVEFTAVRAREAGALVVVDPNIRTRLATVGEFTRVFSRLVPYASVVIAGEDELVEVTGDSDPHSAAQMLLAHGVSTVIGKGGSSGSWALQGNGSWIQNALPSTVVDTIGAGDAFAAGIIASMLRGSDIPSALELGARVAAFVVSTPGDIEGFPTGRVLEDTYQTKGAHR